MQEELSEAALKSIIGSAVLTGQINRLVESGRSYNLWWMQALLASPYELTVSTAKFLNSARYIQDGALFNLPRLTVRFLSADSRTRKTFLEIIERRPYDTPLETLTKDFNVAELLANTIKQV